MMKKPLLLLSLLIACSGIGCQPARTEGFAIYLLEDDVTGIDLPGKSLDQLDLKDEPILTQLDLLSYTEDTHQMELTDAAYQRLERLFESSVGVSGLPFVVTVNHEAIYAGAFWTPISSISFGGVVILRSFDPDNRLLGINLGYPTQEAFSGADPRDDKRIMQVLDDAGKLR
jgi:hypothetical protein